MRIDAISVGKNPPDDVNVIVEVPVGGHPIKYEMDKEAGALVVDRFLYTPMTYPGNYGFVPHTLSEDGDPIDVLIANTRPLVPGCVINVRPIGVLVMEDDGGKDEKITVVNRAKGSGTRATFEGAVLGGESAVKAQEQDSNGTVQKIVSTTPGAISYLAFSYAKTDGLHTLSLDNVAPTDKNITTNKWKIWSYEHMYTNGKAKGQAKKFIDYMLSDDVQGSLVKKLGYISIHDMKVKKDANGKVSE